MYTYQFTDNINCRPNNAVLKNNPFWFCCGFRLGPDWLEVGCSCRYTRKNTQVVTSLQQTCSNAVPTTCQQDVFALLVPSLFTSCKRLVDNLLQGCWAEQTCYKLFKQLFLVQQFNNLSTSCEWQACSNLIKQQHCYTLLTSLLQVCCEHILWQVVRFLRACVYLFFILLCPVVTCYNITPTITFQEHSG
jgi:hypothetical protein